MSETQQTGRQRRAPGQPRGRLIAALLGAATLLATVLVAPSAAHESENDGHIPANTNYGFTPIGRDTLVGVQDEKYTDVWSQDGYAYIGTFQNPTCDNTGVHVIDIAAAIDNFSAAYDAETNPEPAVAGAQVAFIKAAPDTRVNDVKVHTVGDIDVLIATEEPCGAGIMGGAVSDFNINKPCPLTGRDKDEDGNNIGDCNRANDNGNKNQPGEQGPGANEEHGRGGISLYDVTNPEKPKPLEKSFLDFRGVHNTFAWTNEDNGRSYLIGVADSFDFFDVFFVDITDPANPELLSITGALDWIPQGLNLDQLETGAFGAALNHDVWVENIDGTDTAVVSYWDLGFVTLNVEDPANPVFLGDSTYPETDPLGRPYEGNAHAAVFGGNGDYLFAGDEDFAPTIASLDVGGVAVNFGRANFGGVVEDLNGSVVWTGGFGCTTGDIPEATAEGQVALIQRGVCDFSQKAFSAQSQGYDGYIVANDAARGDALLTMAPGENADQVTIPGAFIGFSDGEAIKARLDAGETVIVGGVTDFFDGWGYLRIINNTGAPLEVPDQSPGAEPTISVDPFFEIGYYAPAETLEEPVGDPTAFGDLTMHNIEVDPSNQDVTPTFNAGPRMFVSWYSLGMRALEYRPGHYHANANGEGSYSWNVHEVGRYIAEDGSNYWGVHVDEIDGGQIILASDRNTGLWVFTFNCEADVEGPFYCDGGSD